MWSNCVTVWYDIMILIQIRFLRRIWNGKGCGKMRKKRNKNPLIKRILRELSGDWKKYLVVALFLILTIGFVSGMYCLLYTSDAADD